MADIVTRLRSTDYEYEDAELAFDAADEIERLRAEIDLKGSRLDDALDEIERLREALKDAQESSKFWERGFQRG